jgi:hypothetical protein
MKRDTFPVWRELIFVIFEHDIVSLNECYEADGIVGNVKKNDLPEFQQKLSRLSIGKKDRLFLFMLCNSRMEISTVPLAVQKRIVQPPTFELVG